MTIEFKLPDIGEGVAEGEIVRWIVNEGDAVREDQPMVEVMTDKATVEIGSPVTGRIAKILVQAGQVVPVHSVIVHLEKAGAATSPAPASVQQHAAAHAAAAATASAAVPAVAAVAVGSDAKILAAPATRKLARESGVPLAQVPATGPHGRITRDDLVNYLNRAPAAAATAAPSTARAPSAPVHAAPVQAAPTPAPIAAAAPVKAAAPRPALPSGAEERIPYRGIRKATGDQMVRSAYTAPHFTYVEEIDMTALYALRKEAAGIAEADGVKLTFLPFIIKALCAGLRRFPSVNATLDEKAGEIVVKPDIHVGIATDTERGLMVPVVRNCAVRSLLDIAADMQQLTARARAGQATREELTGSTITITSAGSIGGLFATPIINYPEVAILGVYQIKEKPVVRNGAIVIGRVGYLSITLDHRVVDGGTAAHLMNHMKKLLENPGLLALEG
jgi:pyruvate dehydrogenase E2 component (dihydrolipoamide acetyltransferase)